MAITTDWKIADRAKGDEYEPIQFLNRWWDEIQIELPFTATSPEEYQTTQPQ